MKGFFFTLDVAVALFFLTIVLAAPLYQAPLQSHGVIQKSIGQDILNTMEKTGFLADAGQGKKTDNEVKTYLAELIPLPYAGNLSISSYKYNNGFQFSRGTNVSTANFGAPFSSTKRIVIVPKKGDDDYIVAQLVIGFK